MADPVLIKTAEEFAEDIRAQLAIETGIADTSMGSAIRSLSFGLGMELEHLGYQVFKAQLNGFLKRATGQALDDLGSDWGVVRREETKAVGEVTYTGSATVPVGALVSVPATSISDRIDFEVTQETVVASGSPNVPVQAVLEGSAGNVLGNTITQITTGISGLTAVTNASVTSGGQEQENDDVYRDRILAHIEGLSRGTPVSIVDGCLNFEIEQVVLQSDATAIQNFVEVSDLNLVSISDAGGTLAILDSAGNVAELVSYPPGSLDLSSSPHRITGLTRGVSPGPSATTHTNGSIIKEYVAAGEAAVVRSALLEESPGHVDVYIDSGSTSGTAAELVALVEKRLRGDGTARDPGYRPAGVTLNCYAAVRVQPTVEATVVGSANKAEVAAAVEEYLNNRKLGEDAPAYEIAAVISDYPGVENILSGTLVINGTAHDGTSSADVTTTTKQIIYSGVVTIS